MAHSNPSEPTQLPAARLAAIADRLEIDDLLTRYAVLIDSKAFDQLSSIFTPDAHIDYTSAGGMRGSFPEIVAWLGQALAAYSMSQHVVTNRQIEITGDTATARSYVYNPMGKPDGKGGLSLFFMGGYYRDQLVRTERGWRIRERIEDTAWVDRR